MVEQLLSIEIDGQSFAMWAVAAAPVAAEPARVGDPAAEPAMEVATQAGGRLRLRPLVFRVYLDLLEKHLSLSGNRLQLDRDAFCRSILSAAGVPPALHGELAPLALWWVTGGHTQAVAADRDGWLQLGGLRLKLRPWRLGERSAALRASLTVHPDGTRELRLGQYLRCMVAAAVVAAEPADPDLLALSSVQGAKLLGAVTAICCAGHSAEDLLLATQDGSTPELARTTLRLCQALGWTPSQVWATPAAEVDRLLALLDCAAGSPASPFVPARLSQRPGLSAFADAVTIRVEDG